MEEFARTTIQGYPGLGGRRGYRWEADPRIKPSFGTGAPPIVPVKGELPKGRVPRVEQDAPFMGM